MSKSKAKTMEVEIVKKEGVPSNVGVMIDGEIAKPGDVVTVSLSDARSLIHRGRAVPHEATAAKKSGKASAKASDKE